MIENDLLTQHNELSFCNNLQELLFYSHAVIVKNFQRLFIVLTLLVSQFLVLENLGHVLPPSDK